MSNTSKYRDPSLTPNQLMVAVCTGDQLIKVAFVCRQASIGFEDYTAYATWISQWKQTYKFISEMIAYVKRDTDMIGTSNEEQAVKAAALYSLRTLANTLLNARQYAKDQRRIQHDREFAELGV